MGFGVLGFGGLGFGVLGFGVWGLGFRKHGVFHGNIEYIYERVSNPTLKRYYVILLS